MISVLDVHLADLADELLFSHLKRMPNEKIEIHLFRLILLEDQRKRPGQIAFHLGTMQISLFTFSGFALRQLALSLGSLVYPVAPNG